MLVILNVRLGRIECVADFRIDDELVKGVLNYQVIFAIFILSILVHVWAGVHRESISLTIEHITLDCLLKGDVSAC